MNKIAGYSIESSAIPGSGCTGKVFRAVREMDGKRCAIKFFQAMSIDRNLMGTLLRRLRNAPAHPHIVPLLDFCVMAPPYHQISEFDEGTPLDRCPPLSEGKAWLVIEQLVSALGQAHKFGVVHGNLHPGNLHWTPGENRVRVADFGAGVLGHCHHLDLRESAYFAAPEQLLCLGRDYSDGKAERWDVYGFGAAAYWLLNHMPPRGRSFRKERAQEIARSGGRPVPMDPVALGESMLLEKKLTWRRNLGSGPLEKYFVALIDRCLDLDPARRPVDMREVMEQTERFLQKLEFEESLARAETAIALTESQVRWERNKQKAKLFSARALATILAASCMIASFYGLTFFSEKTRARAQVEELDQVVASQKAHISLLDGVVEDAKGDLKESREAADASFYNMTQVAGKVAASSSATVMKDLEKARVYYHRILAQASEKPDAFLERARALHSLAHIEKKMSQGQGSFRHFGDAVAAYESALQAAPQHDREWSLDILARLADCHENMGRMHPEPVSEDALHSIRQSVRLFRKILEAHPGDGLATMRLAENNFLLGNTLNDLGRSAEAVAAYLEAAEKLGEMRKLTPDLPRQNDLDRMTARLQCSAAEALAAVGRKEEAVNAYISTIESIERFRGIEGYSRGDALMMAKSFLALGDIFSGAPEIGAEDKDQVYNEALRLLTPLQRADPRDFETASLMAATLTRLAGLESSIVHKKEAITLTVRAIEVMNAALDSQPANLSGLLQITETRLQHLGLIRDQPAHSRDAALRGVESATRAHELFVKTARAMGAEEKLRVENQLRRLLSAFGEICSQLGQGAAASRCQHLAAFTAS